MATLILLGVVSHFSDPYNPWINLLARVGNVCVFLYILWRAAGKAIVDGLSNRRAAIVDELDSLAVRKAAAEEQLAAMIEKIDSLDAECETILKDSRARGEAIREALVADALKRRKRFATPRTALPTAKRRKPLRNCGARWPTKSCRLWKLP
ncbi:MAG: ATP synthase F0 subunit B [Bilophila wadsworthia]